MSRVSIIVPIYNAGHFLRDTLESVMVQTLQDWICILVNDGSTDNSLDIINEYSIKDNRFVSYTIPNSGCEDVPLEFSHNKVNTPFCCILDHDDVLESNYLEKLFQRQEETDADIVTSTIIYCKHELEGEIWRLPESTFDMSQVLSGREACAMTIGRWQLSANGMLYRTHLADGIIRGRYMNSDEFSSRQILFKANRVAFSSARYIYRQHTGSISRKIAPRLWQRAYVDLQIVDFVLKHYSVDESVCCDAVSTQFMNLVHFAASSKLDVGGMNQEEKVYVRGVVRDAFAGTNQNRIGRFLPMHQKVFMHGYRWFVTVAVLYELSRRLRGKRAYEYR